MRLEHYIYSLNGDLVNGKLEILSSPRITVRPIRLISNIQKPGQVWISELSINGENQLAVEIDIYQFSQGAYEKMIQTAMSEYGCSTRGELYSYVDDNDIELPDPCRVNLPVIQKGKPVKLIGRGKLDYLFCLSIICMATVE